MFLYKIAVSVVSIALIGALILPNLLEILESEQMLAVVNNVKNFLNEFIQVVTGDTAGTDGRLADFKDTFLTSIKDLLALIDERKAKLVWSLVGCALVYLAKRIADTLCYFAVGSVLNDRMSTYAETPFSAAYVRNLGKAAIYSVVYVPIVFLIDVATVAICYFAFFYLLSFLNVFGSLFLSMTLIVVSQTLKLTFTSVWMPAMIADNKSIKEAMRLTDKKERKQRKQMISTYFVTVYIVIVVNVVAALCTFGSALLLTVPASYFMFICEQFVNYYTVKGKPYFITYDDISKNRDFGDSENFFRTVEDDGKVSNETDKAISAEKAIDDEAAQTERADAEKKA
jgi:hypothetical protein